MTWFFHGIAQKVVALAVIVFTMMSGIVNHPRIISITPLSQSASVSDATTPLLQENVATLSTPSSTVPGTTSTSADATTSPALSKTVTSKVSSSSQGHTPLTPVPAKPKIQELIVSPPKTVTTLTPNSLPSVITPQWLLERTVLSVNQKLDGSYGITLTTNAGTGGTFTWDLEKTMAGGAGDIPQFKATFACDPPPDTPLPDANDQTPSFHMRTSYHCSASLTPLSGNDQRTQSKTFDFTTGNGLVVVTTAANMDTVLKDDANNGGFVFNNEDNQPITITQLTFDILYSSLETSTSPLVIRFTDPNTDQSMLDYHIENLPEDPTLLHTQSQTGIMKTISFKVGAHAQKMLPVEALGVHKAVFPGTDPSIKITLRGITTDQSDTKIALRSTPILWKCILPTAPYDPLATSSPFITGQACRY